MNAYEGVAASKQGYRKTHTSADFHSGLKADATCKRSTVKLIHSLSRALTSEGISYCHWKSNNALDRSISGDNDLDLLVSRADIVRFTELLYRLGFKQAKAPPVKQLPAVLDYFGYDNSVDRLIHVHAHYQLILGHDMTKNFRLPFERDYLESAVQGELFKVPRVEFEFIVFVVRMVLKHLTWDVICAGEGRLKTAERQELIYLQTRIDRELVNNILKRHLPYIDAELFGNCIQALRPACSVWERVRTGQQLQARLRANARCPLTIDSFRKVWRRGALGLRRRVLKSSAKYQLESGGAMIALVGGDGAGKSTAVDALYDWLSKNFKTTRVHLGKPPRSWTTKTVRGVLKTGNLLGLYPLESSLRETVRQKSPVCPGYPWLLREVCRARDRYRTYVKARRFAAKGGLAILDRFPLPQIRLMDGPRAEHFISELMAWPQAAQFMRPHRASRLTQALVNLEESYYHQFAPPEVLLVLRVDPDIAVQRKTDEDPTFVRERSMEIWGLNWERTDAHRIDAGQSKADVLKRLKTLVWAEL